MKKLKWLAPILIVSMIFGIIACKHSTDAPKAPDSHNHTFAEGWTRDETYHWYASTCGHENAEVKEEHTFVDEVCTICEYSRIPEGFVLVKGTTITGTESWTPTSSVFVSGRKLTISDLLVSDHEVTRGEYETVMGSNSDPSTAPAYDKKGTLLTGDAVLNNPVNCVNWYGALVYCNKLSKKENLKECYSINGETDPDKWGPVPKFSDDTWDAATCDFDANGYRLPTEAEWEWLARGGQDYTYAGSKTAGEVAWYASNSQGTRNVRLLTPNKYGLYDMSGNVVEWCWDWHSATIDGSTAEDGPASGDCRVIRGGSFDLGEDFCQVAKHINTDPYNVGNRLGFRVVRTLK